MQVKNILEEALESWEDARLGVIEEVENIPVDKFDYRPTPEVRSVREQVVHILEVAMMMTGELCREDTDFTRLAFPDLLKMHAAAVYEVRSREKLLSLLKSQLEEGVEQFRVVGELHMLQFISRFDGSPGTRLAWLHHGVAQEMYHRGQLALYARLLGLEPALTRKIKGSG